MLGRRQSRPRRVLGVGAAIARRIPRRAVVPLSRAVGSAVVRVRPRLGDGLRSNLRRVVPEATESELEDLVRQAFGAYGRYWADSFQLPVLDAVVIDRHFSVENYKHILDARADGLGAILVLPHLGGWEWAAAWLGEVAQTPVTAAVERLEPDDVFEWFVELREAYGVNVVPVDADALPLLMKAIRAGHVVCLLSDRDVAGVGVDVDFYGAKTRMPSGAALLARRTGAPILPAAVYFQDDRSHCRILAPLELDRSAKLRDFVADTTQKMAVAFETLIDDAPGQWHVLQPAWPDLVGPLRSETPSSGAEE